jgi:hypothetical protein
MILAYNSIKQGSKIEAIVYISLGILFQPIIKIALGRQIWNIVDVIIGFALLISIFIRPSHNR